MLFVVTGAARSGKSRVASGLAQSAGADVTVVVGGVATDAEMERRIAIHRQERPAAWPTFESADGTDWLTGAGHGLVVVECLGSLVSLLMARMDWSGTDESATPALELALQDEVDALVSAIIARDGDTIVISNETGWGVVPAYAAGRLFRDAMGRATARLVDAADGAWLVVAGRCIALSELPRDLTWPIKDGDAL